jgi:hypothetical protein
MQAVDQQELARHLGVTDRRVRQLEVEEVIERLDGEPVRYDLEASARRYRVYAAHDMDTVCRNIEEAAEDVDVMFDRMRQESDIQKRRKIARQDGGAIGRLDIALKLATALAPEHARQMARTFNNLIIGRAASDFLDLCNLRLADEADAQRSGNEPTPFNPAP